MLTSPEEIESFSKECFGGLTNMLGLSLKPPKLDIKPINYRADDILDFIDKETKSLRSYHRHLDRAFRTGVPEEELIVAQAEDEIIEKYFMADYDQEEDRLRVSFFPSVTSLECFSRKLDLRPIRSNRYEVKQFSDSLPEAISGELMRAIRAKAVGYAKKHACPDRLIVAEKWNGLTVRFFDDLEDREYRYQMRRGGYRLRAILDQRDFFAALGYLLGPKAVKNPEFAYEPTMNYEKVLRIRDALDEQESLKNSAEGLLERKWKLDTPESCIQYDAYLPVMSDICFTHYLSGNGFMERHVYNKEDPIIKRPAKNIFMDFF